MPHRVMACIAAVHVVGPSQWPSCAGVRTCRVSERQHAHLPLTPTQAQGRGARHAARRAGRGDAAPCALHRAPCTLYPAPYTLHPIPWQVHAARLEDAGALSAAVQQQQLQANASAPPAPPAPPPHRLRTAPAPLPRHHPPLGRRPSPRPARSSCSSSSGYRPCGSRGWRSGRRRRRRRRRRRLARMAGMARVGWLGCAEHTREECIHMHVHVHRPRRRRRS